MGLLATFTESPHPGLRAVSILPGKVDLSGSIF